MHNYYSPPESEDIRQQVANALAEDIGNGDVTAGLIAADDMAQAHIICRENAVICGIPWAQETVRQLTGSIEIKWLMKDGDQVAPNTVIAQCSGPAATLLTAERTILNFLQTLSSTATQTHCYAAAIFDYPVQILDTRKTLPGLRIAQKYAVRCGGGQNHRMGLFDAYLIKENHIRASSSIGAAIDCAKQQNPQLLVEIEVENLHELEQAIVAKPDRILLDNFSPQQLRIAVAQCQNKIPLEASGGITLHNIAAIAATGINYISLGTLTKDITSVDFSLLFL